MVCKKITIITTNLTTVETIITVLASYNTNAYYRLPFNVFHPYNIGREIKLRLTVFNLDKTMDYCARKC